MPLEPGSRKEHPSTYFVQDRSNMEEMARLQIQDQLVTAGMGGALPEQSNLANFRRVLDVGCGTGNWLLEVARVLPAEALLIGVDVSKKMLDYARTQADAQGVANRVEFHTMDALRMLEFPRSYFDLVNQRLGSSYLRTWDWPNLLQGLQRVTKTGGVIRITEDDIFGETNSPALTRLYTMGRAAFFQAGHLFTPERDGVTSKLLDLLRQQGIQDVQTRAVMLEYGPEDDGFWEDTKFLFRTILPFLRKWLRVPDDYDKIYQQALAEIRQPGFFARWEIVTAWGKCP